MAETKGGGTGKGYRGRVGAKAKAAGGNRWGVGGETTAPPPPGAPQEGLRVKNRLSVVVHEETQTRLVVYSSNRPPIRDRP